jgi:hypothetical protein
MTSPGARQYPLSFSCSRHSELLVPCAREQRFEPVLDSGYAGRGAVFDDISEVTGIGVTTVQQWHHSFTAKFVEAHRGNWLRPPNREELAKIMEVYAAKGMTGAVGSVDCTHVAMDKAPSAHRNLNVSRHGKPTLSFEAIVGPDRFFHSFTEGAHGAQNDKTVAVTDAYLLRIRDQMFFPDVTFTLRKLDGTEVLYRGECTVQHCHVVSKTATQGCGC